jgi:hypothetical protein
MSPAISIRNCRRVPPPAGGFWRATSWHEPFDPPPPSRPIGNDDEDDEHAGRWDDPDGMFRTLYAASLPEGAIGEKLGDFALNPAAAVRIEAFFAAEPDEEFADDQLLRALDADDIDALDWTLAHAGAEGSARFLDVNHWRTHVETAPGAIELLLQFGLRALDRRALLDERRNFTRRLAGLWRSAAFDASDEPVVHGLRYRSRLPPAWSCWALWEPLPLDLSEVISERVTIEHPSLRAAARKLGVQLAA